MAPSVAAASLSSSLTPSIVPASIVASLYEASPAMKTVLSPSSTITEK
jgi:hypothetical protein